jgi:predicted nucleic acid-binding Zn finger protein
MSVSSGEVYSLRWNKEKKGWYCSCPSYIYRGKTCKHIRAFMAGELDNPDIEKVDEFSD